MRYTTHEEGREAIKKLNNFFSRQGYSLATRQGKVPTPYLGGGGVLHQQAGSPRQEAAGSW